MQFGRPRATLSNRSSAERLLLALVAGRLRPTSCQEPFYRFRHCITLRRGASRRICPAQRSRALDHRWARTRALRRSSDSPKQHRPTRDRAGLAAPPQGAGAAHRTRRRAVSSRVLVLNLVLHGEAAACRLTGAAGPEPLWLTWRSLSGPFGCDAPDVHVCEEVRRRYPGPPRS